MKLQVARSVIYNDMLTTYVHVCSHCSQVSQLAGVVRDVCAEHSCSVVLDIGSGLVSRAKAL